MFLVSYLYITIKYAPLIWQMQKICLSLKTFPNINRIRYNKSSSIWNPNNPPNPHEIKQNRENASAKQQINQKCPYTVWAIREIPKVSIFFRDSKISWFKLKSPGYQKTDWKTDSNNLENRLLKAYLEDFWKYVWTFRLTVL